MLPTPTSHVPQKSDKTALVLHAGEYTFLPIGLKLATFTTANISNL